MTIGHMSMGVGSLPKRGYIYNYSRYLYRLSGQRITDNPPEYGLRKHIVCQIHSVPSTRGHRSTLLLGKIRKI